MGKRKSLIVLLFTLTALLVWAGKTLYVLTELTPKAERKPAEGLEIKGNGFHFRNKVVDITVVQLTPLERAAFYHSKKLVDPFSDIPFDENFVFFKVRIENIMKDGKVAFSPRNVMMGNSVPFDEIKVYQLLYRKNKSEQLLSSAGQTIFFRNLVLPANMWIERLMLFQYDDPYPKKNINLIFGSIATGNDSFEVIFPFKASFKKEKL